MRKRIQDLSSLTEAEIAQLREDATEMSQIMTCTIERGTIASTDPDGHPVKTWAVLHENIPCWYYERERDQYVQQERTGPLVHVIDAYPRITLPANTDVTPRDRVTTVIGVDGVEVAANLDIRTVLKRLFDVSVTVESQK
jgi:hypothetical protein